MDWLAEQMMIGWRIALIALQQSYFAGSCWRCEVTWSVGSGQLASCFSLSDSPSWISVDDWLA
jgi:hypothetical protein